MAQSSPRSLSGSVSRLSLLLLLLLLLLLILIYTTHTAHGCQQVHEPCIGGSVGATSCGISASCRWQAMPASSMFDYCRCDHSLFTHGREIAIAVFLTALVCEGITSLLFYTYIEKESTIITTQREDLKKVPFLGRCRHSPSLHLSPSPSSPPPPLPHSSSLPIPLLPLLPPSRHRLARGMWMRDFPRGDSPHGGGPAGSYIRCYAANHSTRGCCPFAAFSHLSR
jgi:hypothetical protein